MILGSTFRRCYFADVESPFSNSFDALSKQILSFPINHVQRCRAQLPGYLGGLTIRVPRSRSSSSHVATYFNVMSRVEQIAAIFNHPLCEGHAVATRASLQSQGGCISADGHFCFSSDAGSLFSSSPWSADFSVDELFTSKHDNFAGDEAYPNTIFGPGNKLASHIQRGLDVFEACRIHQVLDDDGKKCMLSAGGKGSGSIWSSFPHVHADAIDDQHFIVMAPLRLNALQVLTSFLCNTPKSDRANSTQRGVGRCWMPRDCISIIARLARPACGHIAVCK